MKVTFSPNNYSPAGCVSFISWANPDLCEAIRKAFNESPRESIVEIVIEPEGIKAVFEANNSGRIST